MMVIYLPVKITFDWTKCSLVKSLETEMLKDRQMDGITPILKAT